MEDLNARMNSLKDTFEDPRRQISYQAKVDPGTQAHGQDLIVLMKKNELKPLNHMRYKEKRFRGGLTFRKRNNWISQLYWV